MFFTIAEENYLVFCPCISSESLGVLFLTFVFEVSVTFVCVFTTMCFYMFPQTDCPSRCKVTLVAFVWFFSTVFFQMFPQSACLKGGVVTLVAFVGLFSTVCF